MTRPTIFLIAAFWGAAAFAQDVPHPLMGHAPIGEGGVGCASPVEAPRAGEADLGYANIFYFTQNRHAFATIATDDPENPSDIVAIPASAPAGAFVPDKDRGTPGSFYELTFADRNNDSHFRRRSYDGSVTNVGVANPEPGSGWVDMAYHPLTGLLYALATNCTGLNYLYLINPENAQLTLLATLTAAACLISLAIALDGYAYALDVDADRIFRISLATFAMVALAQSIGYTTGFAQGAAFSVIMGLVVLASMNTFGARTHESGAHRDDGCSPSRGQTPEGELRTADVDENGDLTGSTTLLGRISPTGFAEALYYAFPLEPAVSVDPSATPAESFDLSAVYPNPLAHESVMLLQLARSEHVSVTVVDLLGRVVASSQQGVLAGGQLHRLALGVGDLPAGVYLFNVRGESFAATRKAVVQR